MNTTIHIIEQLKWNLLMLKITHIDFGKEVNDKDPKFKVGDHVRISKYKNTTAKGYTSNWSEEVFVIKEVQNTVPRIYAISDLNGKKLQKPNQEKFRIEKVIRRKGNKLYVMWKGYDNSFNSWIDKKDVEWNSLV